ncbi:MAG: autotransporter assembly complex family protein [Paracoccus sp. (in: a-proteobacteria)]|uniref:autotransporter assembly complex protein TamA n=1 Tax=Paracoccus sp. TaxID=267 RepID=UPI0026DEE1C6|nr:autotransporter assembly complex family protein [Paracoccus sp. (in: a-proteobacteria)]MDO5632569.1 autotransporter assembly complex family protein [Paracoccus sp. (in: a-proteobacteria)]
MQVFRAGVLLAAMAMVPDTALAQSSNPFSGLFGGRSEPEGAVSLNWQIAGRDDALDRSLRNTSLIAGALREDRATGQDILAAARADYARLLGALYDLGYYDSVVNITLDGTEAAAIAPLDAPAEVRQVVIAVEPGRQFTFSRAAIAPLAPGTRADDDYAPGRMAGTGIIRGAATQAVRDWRDHGHAKADVAGQQIIADHPSHGVDSQIALDPGPVVTFGPLHVSGNERLIERRLRKIAGYPEGARFDPEDLDTVRKRLRRTGIFSAITLTEAEVLNPDNSMNMDLTVIEQKPRRIGAGFEISNTEGIMLSAYWLHRNLRGGGERLRIDGAVSDIGARTSDADYNLGLRLERPATFHPDVTAYLATNLSRMREVDYDSDAVSLSFGANYIHSDRLTGDMALQYIAARVTDDTGQNDFRALALPSRLTFDARDEPTDAKKGYWLEGQITPFYGFGETGSGGQVIGEGRVYRSFGTDDRITLAGRLRAGTVLGSDIQDTPRDYLFYSGGGGTVRGQPYQSLGVEVIQGPDGPVKTGGMSITTLSAEIRWQVRERIGVVAFADAGQVWPDSSFGGDGGWQSGAGLGVRYATPIGPLRFDVAAPVGGDTGDGVQLYLGLGQAF